MMRLALAILALGLWGHDARAYTYVVHATEAGFVTLAWPNATQTIRFARNDQIGPLLPNLVPDSDPIAAIERAFRAWPAASTIRFELETTSIASAGRDGTNVITFANTPANAAQLEMAGDPIGLTLYFFIDEAFIEADVLFNPTTQFTTTAVSNDELDAQGAADIEAVAVHELGHAIGLNHTGVESASMWGFTSLGQRQLDPDDVAGARALYGMGPPDAAIAGIVRVSGQPAFGAHVVAVAADGPVYGALTLPTGHYRIDALPPRSYTVYVEPLDGPHGSAFVDGCVRFGNMGGAGIFDAAPLTTDFPTTFYGNAAIPTELTLAAGEVVLADFELPAGTSELNPVRIGPGTADGNFSRLAEVPLSLSPGVMQWVAIAGPGLALADTADVRILGAGVSLDPSDVQRPEVSCGGSQLPTLIFPVEVAADAVAGGRTILVSSGDDLAAFTGAIDIQPRKTPPACVGDCDGSGIITVDEIVRGVTISLERAALGTCGEFDRDRNQLVTVDELIAGVNGLLAGCE